MSYSLLKCRDKTKSLVLCLSLPCWWQRSKRLGHHLMPYQVHYQETGSKAELSGKQTSACILNASSSLICWAQHLPPTQLIFYPCSCRPESCIFIFLPFLSLYLLSDSSVAEDKWLSALEGTRWLDYVRYSPLLNLWFNLFQLSIYLDSWIAFQYVVLVPPESCHLLVLGSRGRILQSASIPLPVPIFT